MDNVDFDTVNNVCYLDYVENPELLSNIGIDFNSFNYNLKEEQQSPNWVHQYAYECLTKYKDETCLDIKLACIRHIVDMKRSEYEFKFTFSKQHARKAINFFKLLNHVKGTTSVFTLLPWQQFIVGSIFGWVHKEKRGERVLRRFIHANVFVARKNGKSTLACGIALFMLLVDGEIGADVYTAASTYQQARIVFDDTKAMLKKSVLSTAFGTRINNDVIRCDALNATMRSVPGKAESLDGKQSHCCVLDEIHAFTSSELYDVMQTSVGSRDNPLLFVISTAGTNIGCIGHQLFMDAEKHLRNEIPADDCNTIFDCLFTIDQGDAFDSMAAWHKANPSLRSGARKLDELQAKATEAKYRVSARPNFLTKYLNVFCNSSDKWLEWDVIRDSTDLSIQFKDYIQSDVPCYLGVDIGLTSDLSAIGYVFVHPDGNIKCFSKGFFPRDGLSECTPNQADKDEIKYACKVFNVCSVELDPWNSTQMFNNLIKAKVPAVQRGQGLKDLNEPTKLFEKSILDGQLKHNGNGALMWCMSNACLRVTNNDCVTVEKDSATSEYKIDCLKALVIALAGYVHQGIKKESPWKKGRSRIVSI